MKRRQDRHFQLFLIVSVIIHILSLIVLSTVKPSASKLSLKNLQKAPVNVRVVSREELAKRQNPSMQIVQQKTQDTSQPENDKARYLSQNNNTVEKEMKARSVDDYRNTPFQRPGISTAPDVPPGAGGPKISKQANNLKPGKGAKASRQLVQNLFKSLGQEMQGRSPTSLGGPLSATDDYLKDVPEGERTLLNTKEFKFYSYFERIRQQLKQVWKPLVEKTFADISFQANRRPAQAGEKVTRVGVLMDNDGNIQEIIVLKSSGENVIDSAAIEAFRRAGPFPNPPKGMVESDGSVKLQWEFILVVNA